MPREVIVTFNTISKRIDVLDAANIPFKTSSTQKVDAKNRVYIPSWLREEINSVCDSPLKLCLAIDDQNKPFLAIKTKDLF